MELFVEGQDRRSTRRPLKRLRLSCLKYLAILSVSAANNLAYIMEVVFRLVLLVVLIYIIGQLWKTTYSLHGSLMLSGFTVNTMVWYLAATETIATSQPALTRRIEQEIRSGELAYQLGRPYSYVLYNYARYMGERLVRLFFSAIVAFTVALIFAGPPQITWMGIVAWPFMLWLAISIEFFCYFSIGLLAFWTENAQSLSFVFSRLELVLGGVLAPIAVFPQPLRSIAQILPFSTMLYGPSTTLVHFETAVFVGALVQGILTLLLVSCFASGLYLLASRRVNINGG